jgi:hypothetical protein
LEVLLVDTVGFTMLGSQADDLTAQDRLDVGALLANYSRCLDSGDVDGYVNLFASDGVLDGQTGPRTGHAAIRRVAEAMATAAAQPGPMQGQRHFAGQPVIDGDRQSCQARSYFLVVRQGPSGEALIRAMGEYVDSCVRYNGRWVFARREIRLLLGQFGPS